MFGGNGKGITRHRLKFGRNILVVMNSKQDVLSLWFTGTGRRVSMGRAASPACATTILTGKNLYLCKSCSDSKDLRLLVSIKIGGRSRDERQFHSSLPFNLELLLRPKNKTFIEKKSFYHVLLILFNSINESHKTFRCFYEKLMHKNFPFQFLNISIFSIIVFLLSLFQGFY